MSLTLCVAEDNPHKTCADSVCKMKFYLKRLVVDFVLKYSTQAIHHLYVLSFPVLPALLSNSLL